MVNKTNNPHANARDQSKEVTRTRQPMVLDKARVLRSDDDGSVIVELLTDTDTPPIPAKIGTTMTGSAVQPTVGSEVLVTYSVNGEAWIVDTYYTQNSAVPEYEVGERVVGHPSTDANIHFQNDGSIDIQSDESTVTVNDITIDGDEVQFGDSGAKIYKNSSGELVAVDDNGNETIIT